MSRKNIIGKQAPGTEGGNGKKTWESSALAPKEKRGAAAAAEEAGAAGAAKGGALAAAPKVVAVEDARPKAGAVLVGASDGTDVATPMEGVAAAPADAAPNGAAVPAHVRAIRSLPCTTCDAQMAYCRVLIVAVAGKAGQNLWRMRRVRECMGLWDNGEREGEFEIGKRAKTRMQTDADVHKHVGMDMRTHTSSIHTEDSVAPPGYPPPRAPQETEHGEGLVPPGAEPKEKGAVPAAENSAGPELAGAAKEGALLLLLPNTAPNVDPTLDVPARVPSPLQPRRDMHCRNSGLQNRTNPSTNVSDT